MTVVEDAGMNCVGVFLLFLSIDRSLSPQVVASFGVSESASRRLKTASLYAELDSPFCG